MVSFAKYVRANLGCASGHQFWQYPFRAQLVGVLVYLASFNFSPWMLLPLFSRWNPQQSWMVCHVIEYYLLVVSG
jgi:hypothetical protein